jgi:hypothetical protein
MYVPLPTAQQQPIERVTSAIYYAQAALQSSREQHEVKTASATMEDDEYDETADPELVRIRQGVRELEKTGHYPADDVAHTHANYVSQWLNHPTVDVDSSHRMLRGVRVPTMEEEEIVHDSPGFVRRAFRKQQEDEWLTLSRERKKN